MRVSWDQEKDFGTAGFPPERAQEDTLRCGLVGRREERNWGVEGWMLTSCVEELDECDD